MNLDSLSFALSQISYAVAGLTKKNFKSNVVEISNLVSTHGAEADRHLYRCLFSHIDFSSDARGSGKDTHQIQYLIQECANLIAKPNFASIFCYSLDNPLHQQKTLRPTAQLFTQLSKVLKLTCVQEVAFGLAALKSSNADTRKFATQFVKQKLPQLLNSYIDSEVSTSGESGGLRDTPIEVLHLVLSYLISSAYKESFAISQDQKNNFFKALSKEFSRDRVPVVLAPLLYQDLQDIPISKLTTDQQEVPNIMVETSLAEMLQEQGPAILKSMDHCRSVVNQYGVKNMTTVAVARALAMMTRSSDTAVAQSGGGGGGWMDGGAGSESGGGGAVTWKADVFVQIIKELVPNLVWSDVVRDLDHPGFLVPSKTSLSVLVQAILCAVGTSFPILHLYKLWSNKEGQMSWIMQAIKNPEVFCFADYPHVPVVTECLKSMPDEENRDVAIWKSLDLIEILLQLSDEGYMPQCLELFKYPVAHCPDLLILGICQAPRWHQIKRDLLVALVPTFLGYHPNSTPALHYAWHCMHNSNNTRLIIMESMSDWYMRGDPHDQTRLSRILDLSQDIKALTMLLNASEFIFIIDLAFLASRREYLKLDKWVNDKFREYGEIFLKECVNFLHLRVVPQLSVGGGLMKDDNQGLNKSHQLPVEIVTIMINCLKTFVGSVSPELGELIIKTANNTNLMMSTKQMSGGQAVQTAPTAAGLASSAAVAAAMRNPMAPAMHGMTGLPGMGGQMDSLSALAPLGVNPNSMMGGGAGQSVSGLSSAFQPGLASLAGGAGGAPGSPAKSYTPLGGPLGGGGPGGLGPMQPSQPYNSMQQLTSQLQGLNLHSAGLGSAGLASSIGSGLPGSLGTGLPGGLGSGLPGGLGPGLGSVLGGGLMSGMGQSLGPGLGGGMGQGVGTGLGTGFGGMGLGNRGGGGGAQSLGSLSTQVALSQQPRMENMRRVSQASELTNIFPTQNAGVPFTKDVEDEANSYFQRIYNSAATSQHPSVTIEQTLDMLKRFKDSNDDREKDVFQCMLRNLFEEYRFFQQYPEKELQTTAILFGGIIENGLVTYMALGVALRYILEALKKPQNSKMYCFGLSALDRCKAKLKEYPQYCQFLASITHFCDFPPVLKEYIEYGARSLEAPSASRVVTTASALPPISTVASVVTTTTTAVSTTTTTTTTTVSAPLTTTSLSTTAATHGAISRPANAGAPSRVRASIATATNIDTLLANKDGTDNILVPSESLQDRVFFIFNNLSQANMDQKAAELLDCMGVEYIAWVAQYMVMKRASIEHNFHTLYANYIDNLKYPGLIKLVVKETYRNIKVLLRSDKGVANFSDRTLLKNLGHWLGMLTVAKNKPILYIDIDLKSLIFEAYHKGAQELLYVVPFVAKVIESSVKSKIFRPPNPWTMGIMNVLGELHREPDIRLNLKFEIEVLCKHLCIDVNELPQTHYLKDISRLEALVHQLSMPTPAGAVGGGGAATIASGNAAGVPGSAKPKDAMTPQPEEPLQINMPTPTSAIMSGASVAMQGVGGMGAMPPVATGMISSPMAAGGVGGAAAQQQQPQFSFNDINIMSPNGLAQHIAVSDNIQLLQAHPQLKAFIKPAIERAVQEMLAPTIDRAMKIAINTCEQIVKKDFALDPDESRMRAAAHHLVRFMTAGMALITAHEPVHVSISNQLKSIFITNVRATTQPQKDMIEQAANQIAADNTELATNFIQKTAVEKAIPEIDKRLANDYELRKHARTEGRRYCDPVVLTYQAERMPEQIRLKVGGITVQQASIYEEFSRHIPGFLPAVSSDAAAAAAAALSAAGGMGGAAGMSVASIPGVVNVSAVGVMKHPYMNQPMQPLSAEDLQAVYEKIGQDIDQHLRAFMSNTSSPLMSSLRTLLEYVLLARNSVRDQTAALALLHRAVEGLLEGLNLSGSSGVDMELMYRYRDSHLLVLQTLNDPRLYGPQWTIQKITRCVMDCREEYRYNIDAVECLVKNQYVFTPQYDLFIAQQLEVAANAAASAGGGATGGAGGGANNYIILLGFCMQLIQRFCTDTSEKYAQQRLPEGEFCHTIDMLARVAAVSRQPPEGLTALLDAVRTHNGGDGGLIDRSGVGLPTMMHSGINQAKEVDDPPGLNEKTEFLLREWVNLYHSPAAGRDSKNSFSTFVAQMHMHGILKTDDLITRFFRICTEMCIDLCYRALSDPNQGTMRTRVQCFHTLDAFVRLIALLLKHSGDTSNTVTKINLLNKVLGIVVGVLLQDHDTKRTEFQQLPYHRIFIMLFIELSAPEPILEQISFDVLQAYCNTLHILRPGKASGFAYSWLELVSHRTFMGRMLAQTQPPLQQKAWGMYAQLLMDQFKFLAPFLRNADLTKPTQLLYKGTMRVLLVLLHDFPEFLCDYHYAFCDVIPSNCIQVRNLILSAFPRNMRLPDPFTPNLKVDVLPEITNSPRTMTNFVALIQPERFKKDMDSYLKTRSPVTFLSELRSRLQVSSMPGMKYNVTLMNALVLHVGTQAIAYINAKSQTPSMSTIAHSSHMDIFQNLAVDLDTEGRYLFLNAVANQLRYPNSHTHYFSCTILYLFAEANTEAIQEQITRVLLERLIVNRPHPWGLLITFIELIKNPIYKFWNHDFVHCAPEIEKLLDSVARSCMPIKPTRDLE